MKTMHSSTELQAMPFIPVVSLYVPGISLEQNITLFSLFLNTVLRDGFKIRPLMSFMNSMQPSHSYYHPLMKLFKETLSHCAYHVAKSNNFGDNIVFFVTTESWGPSILRLICQLYLWTLGLCCVYISVSFTRICINLEDHCYFVAFLPKKVSKSTVQFQ